MAVFSLGWNDTAVAAPTSNGATTPANTVTVTPTRQAFARTNDRVYVFVAANNTSATTPTNWTAVFKDSIVGSGAPGAGTGQRYLSCYYRDYDGSWSMPAFTLTSATQNTQTVGTLTLRKNPADTWDAPTFSSTASDFGTANTSFSATTTSFTTIAGALLMSVAGNNDFVSMTSGAITGTNGFVSGTVYERADGGLATGNDVSLQVHSCTIQTAGSPAGTLTHTGTLSAASEGGVIFVQQTVTSGAVVGQPYFESGTTNVNNSAGPNCEIPGGVNTNDVVIIELVTETTASTVTAAPANFVQVGSSPITGNNGGGLFHTQSVWWKRATAAESGTYSFTLSGAVVWDICARRYSGCIQTGTPIDFTTSAITNNPGVGATGNVPTVSGTTSVSNTLLLWSVAANTGATLFANTSGLALEVCHNTVGHGCATHSLLWAAAGATGSITGTYASALDDRPLTCWLSALKPPAIYVANKGLSVAVRRAGFY